MDLRKAGMLPNAETADNPRSNMVMCYVTCPLYHMACINMMTAGTQSEKLRDDYTKLCSDYTTVA